MLRAGGRDRSKGRALTPWGAYGREGTRARYRYTRPFNEPSGGPVIVGLITCAFPAYNEQDNIGPLLDEALTALPALADAFEIIVVDDGSRDRTSDVVRHYADAHPEVRLVVHPQNLGYGHALRSGLTHARGDVVAIVDGDRQFHVADLRRLVERIGEADVVIGRRIKRADPWHRLLIARVYHVVVLAMFGLPVHDVDCGMKLFARKVVDDLLPQLESRSAFISPELVIRANHDGFRIEEVPVPHYPRIAGRPKGATPRVIARTIGEIVRLRRSLGRRRRGAP